MKKIFFGILLLSGMLLQNCKTAETKDRYTDILNTQDIAKIEAFLKDAHPEDPRRTVLKPKLIALKNLAWTSGAKNAQPMSARPIVTDIPKTFTSNPNSPQAEEFKNLMAETSTAHKEKTVKLLNTLFDQDITSKEAILLVQNNSDCNMIVRISGDKKFYNLAVPAKGQNSLVVIKGQYNLESDVCGIKYTSKKDLQKSKMVILNKPVVNDPVQNSAQTTISGKAQR